jgi:hypothetical protein
MDPVQAAGRDQALQDANVMCTNFRPAEHPVVPVMEFFL